MPYSDTKTLDVLQRLWYSWGMTLIQRIEDVYELEPEYKKEIERLFLRPNDWHVCVIDDE